MTTDPPPSCDVLLNIDSYFAKSTDWRRDEMYEPGEKQSNACAFRYVMREEANKSEVVGMGGRGAFP